MKITVIGAGHVGETTVQRLVDSKLAGEVVMVDILEGIPQGKALDMLQSTPVTGADVNVIGTNNYNDTAGSDIIVMTAGLARKPGMSRDDLLVANADIVKSCISAAAAKSPDAIIVMVSNPLDVMTYLALKISGFSSNRVVGMAGILDTARFSAFVSMELGVSVQDIQAMVLGGHGDSMVPVLSHCTVGGIPVTKLIKADRLEEIVQRTRDGGAEIVGFLKTGSAYYAPSAGAVQMVDAIVNDQKRILPCAAYPEGKYGLDDLYVGLPVKLGAGGVEEVIEIDLTGDEMAALKKSAESVSSNFPLLNL
ncbi:malate dehydrogenase [candidate division KSB1 bacterium]